MDLQGFEQTLPLKVETLLVKEQERSFHRLPGFLRRYSLVVTTFWHTHEVQKLLRKGNIEVMADASREMLRQRLAQLASGTEIRE